MSSETGSTSSANPDQTFPRRPRLTLIGKKQSFPARVVSGLASALSPTPAPAAAERRRIDVLGHRGDPRAAAENTVLSCQNAIQCGAVGVEVDLCVTRDGHAVLCHDHDPDSKVALARQSVGEGLLFVPHVPPLGSELRRRVSELTLEQFRSNYGYRRHTSLADALGDDGEPSVPVATLAELAAWAEGEPRAHSLIFDIKLDPDELELVGALCASFAGMCARHPSLSERHMRLLCPKRELFHALRAELGGRDELSCFRIVPDFELGAVVETARELAARDVSIGVTPRRLWLEVREDIAAAVRARDAGELDSVIVWGAEDDAQLAQVIELGVDALITDRIETAQQLVAARARG